MYIGSGKCEILFPKGFFPSEGFVCQTHALYARALVLGAVKPFVLVSVEMTSLPDDEVLKLRGIVASSAATRVDRVWVTVTHTFSAPHILPGGGTADEQEHVKTLKTILRDAVHTAVLKAKANAREDEILFYQGQSALPVCRDIELSDGWWVGGADPEHANPLMSLFQFGREMPQAFLLHMNMQSSVLDGTGVDGGKCVSPDAVGVACDQLERLYPGATAIFMLGGGEDQAPSERGKMLIRDARTGAVCPSDLGAQSVPLCEKLGNLLTQEVCDLMCGQREVLGEELSCRETTVILPTKEMKDLHELHPCRRTEWITAGDTEQPIYLLSLGGVQLIGIRPEITRPMEEQIRLSGAGHVLTATLVNGCAGYISLMPAYEKCMYEAQNSPFAPGAGETLLDAVRNLLRQSMEK